MAFYRQTNAGQTSGTNVTAPSGATADGSTQYNAVSSTLAQTLKYDNTHLLYGDAGDSAVKFATGATVGPASAGFGSNATYATQSSVSACFYFTANPASATRILNLSGNGTLSLGGGGLLQAFDSAGTGGGAMTNTIPLNAWFRAELRVVVNSATVGQMECRLFTDPFSTVPLETKLSGASLNTTTAAPTGTNAGMVSTNLANFGPAWFTQLQYSSTAGVYPPAPVRPLAVPVVNRAALIRAACF